MNPILTIPYRGGWNFVICDVVLIVVLFPLYHLAATNHQELILNGIPFSQSGATILYWSFFGLLLVSAVFMTLEVIDSVLFRPSIKLTDTTLIIPGGALRPKKSIPYHTITKLNENVTRRRGKIINTQLGIHAGGRCTWVSQLKMSATEYNQLKQVLAAKMSAGRGLRR